MQSKKMMASVVTGAIFLGILAGCASDTTSQKVQPTNTPINTPANTPSKSETKATEGATAKKDLAPVTAEDVARQFAPPKKGENIAMMTTSMGIIKIKFFPEVAPKAVENFVTHSKNGYYNGLKFHRVMNDFMIQGGDPKGNGTGGESIWKKPFEDEVSNKLSNFRGALSMANSGPNTNGSQFFIVQNKKTDTQMLDALRRADKAVIGRMQMNKTTFSNIELDKYAQVGGTPWLDLKHTVFGQVYEGMDVVDKIAAVEMATPGGSTPKKDVKIEKIEIKTAE